MPMYALRARRASRIALPRRTALAGTLLLAVAVLGFAAPVRAQSFDRADAAAIERYTLTMPKFDAWVRASTEIANAMKGKSDDEKNAAAVDMSSAYAIDEIADRLSAVPEVRRAVRNARLTPREYTILNVVILQTMLADAMKRANPNAATPKGVNAANLEFLHANRAQIEARLKALQAARAG